MQRGEQTCGGPQRTHMLFLEHDSARLAITFLSSANDDSLSHERRVVSAP
jgi:hypothetical protein